MKKVAIIDYQLSNLFSVKHACDQIGVEAKITSDPNDILTADGAILPGVGAFKDAMKNIRRLKLDSTIKKFVAANKSFLGVCLGLQLIFDESEEFGPSKGLGLIKGQVKRFPAFNEQQQKIRVPQIGWNKITSPNHQPWQHQAFSQLPANPYMYFVHSYCVFPDDPNMILSLTEYSGFSYCSSVSKGNILAVQFHPEKSGPLGVSIYEQWAHQLA